ncbi:aminoglycoside phosphotransferase family protein [Tritonibacter horizontis]|nr:aminoglycoside phosphotransferase family protein [Tritonibacter horizontis]
MRRFALTQAEICAETPMARVWSVRRADGTLAALKLYRAGHLGNEATGLEYLRRCTGDPAVTIHDAGPDAVVMGWLEGPSLGDLARQGDPVQADGDLAAVAQALRLKSLSAAGLLPLTELFRPLLVAKLATPQAQFAQQVASKCLSDLATGRWPVVALHGDLHHDNVILTSGGLRVIDAKGLAGPAAYELANAFRHPRGGAGYALQPAVIARRLSLWSDALDCSSTDLLRWAIAKVALSMVWAGDERPGELAVLRALVREGARSGVE